MLHRLESLLSMHIEKIWKIRSFDESQSWKWLGCVCVLFHHWKSAVQVFDFLRIFKPGSHGKKTSRPSRKELFSMNFPIFFKINFALIMWFSLPWRIYSYIENGLWMSEIVLMHSKHLKSQFEMFHNFETNFAE